MLDNTPEQSRVSKQLPPHSRLQVLCIVLYKTGKKDCEISDHAPHRAHGYIIQKRAVGNFKFYVIQECDTSNVRRFDYFLHFLGSRSVVEGLHQLVEHNAEFV